MTHTVLFFRRKVGKRTSHRTHHSIWAKAFGIPKDLSRKVLWSEFEAEASTFNAHVKSTALPCFFYFSSIVGTAVPNLRFKVLFEKSALKIRKTFAPNTPLYLDEAFEDSQETFSEKFLVSGFGAEASTFNAHKKRGKSAFFIF